MEQHLCCKVKATVAVWLILAIPFANGINIPSEQLSLTFYQHYLVPDTDFVTDTHQLSNTVFHHKKNV